MKDGMIILDLDRIPGDINKFFAEVRATILSPGTLREYRQRYGIQ